MKQIFFPSICGRVARSDFFAKVGNPAVLAIFSNLAEMLEGDNSPGVPAGEVACVFAVADGGVFVMGTEAFIFGASSNTKSDDFGRCGVGAGAGFVSF